MAHIKTSTTSTDYRPIKENEVFYYDVSGNGGTMTIKPWRKYNDPAKDRTIKIIKRQPFF